jgi:hypothetical protein
MEDRCRVTERRGLEGSTHGLRRLSSRGRSLPRSLCVDRHQRCPAYGRFHAVGARVESTMASLCTVGGSGRSRHFRCPTRLLSWPFAVSGTRAGVLSEARGAPAHALSCRREPLEKAWFAGAHDDQLGLLVLGSVEKLLRGLPRYASELDLQANVGENESTRSRCPLRRTRNSLCRVPHRRRLLVFRERCCSGRPP